MKHMILNRVSLTEKRTNISIAITVIVAVLLVVVDQISKKLVLDYLKDADPVTVIDGVIQFRYVENTGAAFGILSNNTWALSVFTGIIIIAGFVYLFFGKIKNKFEYSAIILMLAGGLGNLIDRVFRHYVVDFIEYTFMDYAVFNFADICVTVGAVLIIIAVIVETVKEKKSNDGEENTNE